MRVVVLYTQPADESTVAEQDVLVQRDSVCDALIRQGHEATSLPCTLNLESVRQELAARRPDAVFNLVEALGGTDRMMHLAPALLDAMDIPYTGASTETILRTSNKPSAKALLREHGLPTPDWLTATGGSGDFTARRVIVKTIWEHASFGMDDEAVAVVPNEESLRGLIEAREQRAGRVHFAEAFVEGREFNLSLLAGDDVDNPQVLPAAEIDFSSLPKDRPRIVGYRAKWDETSHEYHNTPRRFDFPQADDALLGELRSLARKCWKLFGLSGYARVDFRIDEQGRPWILEVNANPCLAPDAGFAAAVERAGLRYDLAIERIVAAAVR